MGLSPTETCQRLEIELPHGLFLNCDLSTNWDSDENNQLRIVMWGPFVTTNKARMNRLVFKGKIKLNLL